MIRLRALFGQQRWLIVLGAIALAALGYPAMTGMAQRASARDSVTIVPARAAALIEATSGDEAAAVGDKARLINASLPFSKVPLQAARAFVLPSGVLPSGGALDQRRALLCLTQAVYYEAGFEPLEGRRAVAQVVINRMRHPAFPKSVCGVVYQRDATPVCQFTFVCDGSLDRRPAAAAWKQAEQVARAALAGHVEQSVGSATHYHADYVAPRWAPLLTKISKHGAHIFYRWPGAWGRRGAFTGRYIGEPSDPASLRPAFRPIEGSPDPSIASGPITDGTRLKRASNDVGGLLDASKGWTLDIPIPAEAGAASRAVAQRQASLVAPLQSVAAVETRVIASR